MEKECLHEWETIKKYEEVYKTVGNMWVGIHIYSKPVYVQQCKKCKQIRKI